MEVKVKWGVKQWRQVVYLTVDLMKGVIQNGGDFRH
jgi:hypothetical protein